MYEKFLKDGTYTTSPITTLTYTVKYAPNVGDSWTIYYPMRLSRSPGTLTFLAKELLQALK